MSAQREPLVQSGPPPGVPVQASPAEAKPRWKMTLKLVAFVAIGALVGYGYHRLIGCRSGTCPITANPYISTIYGAVMGFLVSGGIK